MKFEGIKIGRYYRIDDICYITLYKCVGKDLVNSLGRSLVTMEPLDNKDNAAIEENASPQGLKLFLTKGVTTFHPGFVVEATREDLNLVKKEILNKNLKK